jgi:DNA-binding NarL/FixJ family response regulator
VTEPVRVVVADSSPFFRDALRHGLRDVPDITVVAVAGTAADAVRLAVQHLPAVAVLDVHLDGNGVHAIRQIHRAAPTVKIVALCGVIDGPSEQELAELGVVEYLIKGVAHHKIIDAVRRVADALHEQENR